jgi:ankyrin repeat protein
VDTVNLLLKQAGMRVNQQSHGDRTALTQAAFNGHGEVVQALLAHHDINVNQPTSHSVGGVTALYNACSEGYGTHVVCSARCCSVYSFLKRV